MTIILNDRPTTETKGPKIFKNTPTALAKDQTLLNRPNSNSFSQNNSAHSTH